MKRRFKEEVSNMVLKNIPSTEVKAYIKTLETNDIDYLNLGILGVLVEDSRGIPLIDVIKEIVLKQGGEVIIEESNIFIKTTHPREFIIYGNSYKLSKWLSNNITILSVYDTPLLVKHSLKDYLLKNDIPHYILPNTSILIRAKKVDNGYLINEEIPLEYILFDSSDVHGIVIDSLPLCDSNDTLYTTLDANSNKTLTYLLQTKVKALGTIPIIKDIDYIVKTINKGLIPNIEQYNRPTIPSLKNKFFGSYKYDTNTLSKCITDYIRTTYDVTIGETSISFLK